MAKRLAVFLLPNWAQADNPDGPTTLYRTDSERSGALHVSLYAEYKDKGVEFIGVSLDQKEGGLEKLKDFVHKEGITWPQYFQGDGWNSEFSKSWGIRSIPALFVVDQEGKVYSDKARGKLETILPELLKRRPNQSGARSVAS